MKTNPQPWFEILKAARTVSKAGEQTFVAADLAKAADLKDTFPSPIEKGPRMGQMGKGSTAQQLAAAWLTKFRKWGYVEVSEKIQTGAPRPTFAWKLTPQGLAVELRDGVSTKLAKLVEAARALQTFKGKAGEQSAWKDFIKVLDLVDEKKEDVE
jgi:hypothetical protein